MLLCCLTTSFWNCQIPKSQEQSVKDSRLHVCPYKNAFPYIVTLLPTSLYRIHILSRLPASVSYTFFRFTPFGQAWAVLSSRVREHFHFPECIKTTRVICKFTTIFFIIALLLWKNYNYAIFFNCFLQFSGYFILILLILNPQIC